MTRKSTGLPDGAGATTGASSNQGTRTGRTGGFAAGAEFSEDRSGGGELMVADARGRPSTAAVVGAAIAGAVAGAAIPFMFAGRSARAAAPGGREETVVRESIVIDRPARQLYDFWRNFENLPQFMDNIKSVETIDRTRSHWVIKAPAGTSVSFDSRVLDDVPGRAISWESEEGASVPNRGRVEFIETASGTGTNVRVTMSYEPPAGAAGRAVAKLFQREPSVQAREDLKRFKELMEGAA